MQETASNSKVHGANMEPTWGQQDPGGPHVGPMNFTISVHHALTLEMKWVWGLNNNMNIGHET